MAYKPVLIVHPSTNAKLVVKALEFLKTAYKLNPATQMEIEAGESPTTLAYSFLDKSRDQRVTTLDDTFFQVGTAEASEERTRYWQRLYIPGHRNQLGLMVLQTGKLKDYREHTPERSFTKNMSAFEREYGRPIHRIG
ncbi:MAG: hypothetical protein WDZ81_01450 [Candidatus Saccharimonadales bacterium]